LTLLGGNVKFSKGVQVGLTPNKENLLSFVPGEELLLVAFKMHFPGLVLMRLVANICNQNME